MAPPKAAATRDEGTRSPAPASVGRKKKSVADDPRVLAYWHPKLNAPVRPEDVWRKSNDLYYWRCPKRRDHVWRAKPANRGYSGCPVCAHRIVARSDSLAVRAPRLLRELHPTKNPGIDPEAILPTALVQVFWRCRKNRRHVWRSTIFARNLTGAGCPFCARRSASAAHNFEKSRPKAAKLWHPAKNGTLRPKDLTPSSKRTVWWRCPKGPDHEWKQRADEVGNKRYPCPFCSNLRVSVTNSLAGVRPDLASELDRVRNGFGPEDILAGSAERVWWKCPAGHDHVWSTVLAERVTEKGRCPFCTNRRLSVTNCLATRKPRLAREWHPWRNGQRTPKSVVYRTTERFWWRCALGHEWRAKVHNRSVYGSGCPACARRRPRKVVMRRRKILG